MTFVRTEDMSLVRTVMVNPAIYPHISDDGSPPAEEFQPVDHPSIWYVRVDEGGDLLGLFMFVPHGVACWEVHTCLLPSAWGDHARAAGFGVIEWIWGNTPCCRIITNVPNCNRLALRFAQAAGLENFGVNEKSYLKNGKLYDQIMLGISRPEAPCPQP